MRLDHKPAQHAESVLIHAILDGGFPPGSSLPAERDLATRLGITRPTLRETLKQLDRDGWLTIRHGKATLVNHYWADGGLNVLSSIVRVGADLPHEFISHLLQIRLILAPAYTKLAVARDTADIMTLLADAPDLNEDPSVWTDFDWTLQHHLARNSGNPVFALILNGFRDLFAQMGPTYFANPEACAASASFYAELVACCRRNDSVGAARVTKKAMKQSLLFWQKVNEVVA